MTLINVLGDVGSGKTLFTTALAVDSIKPVFGNYHIKIDNFTLLVPEMLIGLNTGSLVIVDEAYSWLESRLSGARDINRYLSYILFQSRKRDMDILTTDQLIETIDLRFRLMANWEIHCENVNTGYKYLIKKISRYHNYRPITVLLTYEKAEKYYQLYNSWELINPIDDGLMFSISTDKTNILKDIDKIVDSLLEVAPAYKYTKGIVKDYCFEHKLPIKMHEDIYNRLKARALKLDSVLRHDISKKQQDEFSL